MTKQKYHHNTPDSRTGAKVDYEARKELQDLPSKQEIDDVYKSNEKMEQDIRMETIPMYRQEYNELLKKEEEAEKQGAYWVPEKYGRNLEQIKQRKSELLERMKGERYSRI